MAEKMFKKLDLSNVKIYKNTNEDLLSAMDLIGQEVYVSDEENFEYYQKFTLAGVKKVIGCPFNYVGRTSDNLDFAHKYFILAKDARFVEEEPKKLRPYKDISEFANETGCEEIGVVITIRSKDGLIEETVAYNGYRTVLKTNKTTVFLGVHAYTFEELKNGYLYLGLGEWLPFGIEE